MTINNNWGYCESDNAFKSEREILTYLLYCARYRGNLLLNIGPRQDGSVQTECIERLHGIGDWLELNGEAIYGSERHSITEQNHPFAWVTARGRKAYAHIMDGSKESARIAGIRGLIANAKILGSNTPASVCSHRDGTLDLTGLPCTAGKPAVVALELSPGARFVRTSGILLPADIPESASENGVIIVGADRGREAPPLTRTIDAQDIASGPATVLSLTGGSHWVPDWDRAVATGRCSTVEIAFHADVEGRYDLDIGVVCREPAGMTATLDGAVAPAGVQRIPGGYPATFELRNVRLAQGCHVLNLTSSADDNMIGVYGYCLSPRWQGIPSQCWATIGPFPTEFHSAAPVSTVRSAIQTQFIDEASFDPSETYRGAGNISVGWVNVHRGRGEHSQRGVDYVCRGTPRFWGVCYARTLIVSPTERDVELCFGCDWWANLWMNGKSVVTSRDPASIAEDGAMFNGHKPSIVRCRLTAGENVLLVKSHPGRAAHWITCFLNNPGDLVCKAGK